MTDFTSPVRDWLPTAWVAGYIDGLPDLCIGRLPPEISRPDGRWKIWIVERPAERAALLAAPARPIPLSGGGLDFRSGPDAAVAAQGRGGAVVALYPPAAEGWPWVTLVRLPRAAPGYARGVYATDTDETEAGASQRISRLRLRAPGVPVRLPGGLRH